MYLTREQITNIIQKVGQPDASILLNRFFFEYKNKLTSQDVAGLYDEQYFNIISNHTTHQMIEGQYKINTYNRYSYDYIKPKIKSDSTLLDLGCGNGDFVLAVATLGLKLATGIDPSKTAIDSAKKKSSKFSPAMQLLRQGHLFVLHYRAFRLYRIKRCHRAPV